MKDPITGHGTDPIYYYDDEIAECSCSECKPYRMCWPREMFGAGQHDNLRNCSSWTLLCVQRIKKAKRIKYPEWACFMSWRKAVYIEGHKLERIKKGRNQEETMAKNEMFQKYFLPLFDKLDKNLCYSFVLQHSDNRMVLKHQKPGLVLTHIYSVTGILEKQ